MENHRGHFCWFLVLCLLFFVNEDTSSSTCSQFCPRICSCVCCEMPLVFLWYRNNKLATLCWTIVTSNAAMAKAPHGPWLSQQCSPLQPFMCAILYHSSFNMLSDTILHTQTHLTALFPGLPGWAGTRKVKPIWISLKQETVSGSGISWAICKSAPCSRQITTPAPHHSVFYRLDALPAAQPTASKHWRQPDTILHNCYIFWWLVSCHMAPAAIRLVPALFPGQMS